MRQLEAFTLGKTFGDPETNEDSLVVSARTAVTQ